MDNCIEFTGYRARNGYGQKWWNGKLNYAHRLAWENKYGKIPMGMLVLHSCDNPPCVNTDHLFLGTHLDNLLDAQSKGRMSIARHGTIYMYSHYRCRCDDC